MNYPQCRPTTCPHCRAPLVQPASGRPRLICPDPACQRQADADRRRRLRRQKAGIPVALGGGDPNLDPQPGGRVPLIRRMAREIAVAHFPHVTPDERELAALEAAVRAGARVLMGSVVDHGGLIAGQAHWRTGLILSADDRRTLWRFGERNRRAAPTKPRPASGSGVRGNPSIVGKLPEPFVRKRGARGTGHGPGWIELPLPPQKRQVELPLPPQKRLIEL